MVGPLVDAMNDRGSAMHVVAQEWEQRSAESILKEQLEPEAVQSPRVRRRPKFRWRASPQAGVSAGLPPKPAKQIGPREPSPTRAAGSKSMASSPSYAGLCDLARDEVLEVSLHLVNVGDLAAFSCTCSSIHELLQPGLCLHEKAAVDYICRKFVGVSKWEVRKMEAKSINSQWTGADFRVLMHMLPWRHPSLKELAVYGWGFPWEANNQEYALALAKAMEFGKMRHLIGLRLEHVKFGIRAVTMVCAASIDSRLPHLVRLSLRWNSLDDMALAEVGRTIEMGGLQLLEKLDLGDAASSKVYYLMRPWLASSTPSHSSPFSTIPHEPKEATALALMRSGTDVFTCSTLVPLPSAAPPFLLLR